MFCNRDKDIQYLCSAIVTKTFTVHELQCWLFSNLPNQTLLIFAVIAILTMNINYSIHYLDKVCIVQHFDFDKNIQYWCFAILTKFWQFFKRISRIGAVQSRQSLDILIFFFDFLHFFTVHQQEHPVVVFCNLDKVFAILLY